MKKASALPLLCTVILVSVFSIACQKNDTSELPPTDDPDISTGTVLAQGVFSGNRNYQVSGSVRLIDQAGKFVLRLENFSASSGPDLKVYLATNTSASGFISLGALKSQSGNQNYSLTSAPDLTRYTHALIWCEQFGALFGAATLK
jgi:Electron transfer DM13